MDRSLLAVAALALAFSACDGPSTLEQALGASCATGEKCADGLACVAGTCEQACSSTQPCPASAPICDDGGCRAKSDTDQCVASGDCAVIGDARCVTTTCDEGKCVYSIAEGSECAAAGCGEGVLHGASTCDATGVCVASSTTPCNGYACADTQTCADTCLSDQDCTGALTCQADHTCKTVLDLGGRCTSDGECATGNCVGGVCCDSACDGLCQACGPDGACNLMPLDDSRCGTVECSSLSTTCRTYSDLTANRCAAFGTCKTVSEHDCTTFSDADATTWCAGTPPCDAKCDGAGACGPYPGSTTHCGAQTFVCNTGSCNGAGDCVLPGSSTVCGTSPVGGVCVRAGVCSVSSCASCNDTCNGAGLCTPCVTTYGCCYNGEC